MKKRDYFSVWESRLPVEREKFRVRRVRHQAVRRKEERRFGSPLFKTHACKKWHNMTVDSYFKDVCDFTYYGEGGEGHRFCSMMYKIRKNAINFRKAAFYRPVYKIVMDGKTPPLYKFHGENGFQRLI